MKEDATARSGGTAMGHRWKPDRITVCFFAVLLLAVGLRMLKLSTWDMWTDEVHTLWNSHTGQWLDGPMYRTAPINFFLTKLAIQIFGPNELGSRIVPFLSGVILVAFMYILFRRWIGRRAALFSMLVVTLSVWHIFWSQAARHFSLEMLFLLGAIHGFLVYRQEGKWYGLVLSAVLFLAAMFTHSSAGIYLAAMLTFVAGSVIADYLPGRPKEEGDAARTKKDLVALASFAVIFAVYLPIYLTIGHYILANRTPWNPPWNILGSILFYLPPYFSLPAAAGAVFLGGERNRIGYLLLCLIVVPVLLVTAASVFTIASGSYCLPSLIAVAALAGVAFDRLLDMARSSRRVLYASILVGAVFAMQATECALYFTYYNGLKPRWKEACSIVAGSMGKNEILLASEGDVARFYIGDVRAEWFGKYSRQIGSADFPPSGVKGVWYAIYLSDSSILRTRDEVLRRILDRSKLVALLPVHYGAKDRTIGVFREEVDPSPR